MNAEAAALQRKLDAAIAEKGGLEPFRSHALQHLQVKTVIKVRRSRPSRPPRSALCCTRRRQLKHRAVATPRQLDPYAQNPRDTQESHCCQIQSLAVNLSDPSCRNLFATAAHGQVSECLAAPQLKRLAIGFHQAQVPSCMQLLIASQTPIPPRQVTIYDGLHFGDHIAVVCQYAGPLTTDGKCLVS
jgi:hypothetical protein